MKPYSHQPNSHLLKLPTAIVILTVTGSSMAGWTEMKNKVILNKLLTHVLLKRCSGLKLPFHSGP